MKKSSKTKTVKTAKRPKQTKPDIAGLLTKLEQKMVILEMKVDVLIERLTVKPPVSEPKPQPSSVQAGPVQRGNEVKGPAANGGRIMHKAVCADCTKECEVPFQPREGRAVYCKECFSKRKSGGRVPVQVNGNIAPARVSPAQAKPAPAPAVPERKKWGNVKRKGPEAKKGQGKTRRR